MEAEHHHLQNLLVLLLGAIVAVPLAQRLRVSPVVGYLAAGLAIGPYALALVRDAEEAQALAEYGVIFLLFSIGLDLPLSRLKAMWRYIFGLGLAQVALTSAIAGAIAAALGFGLEAAFVIGGGLAFSSTAAVLQLLSERRELNTRFGRVALGVLLFQDLAVVPLLAVLPLLGAETEALVWALALAAFKALAALAAVFALGRLVLRPLYRHIASERTAEIITATNLLVALGAGWATAQLGLSMALGAFLAGLLLAETEFRHQVEADIQPFRGLLLGLFFMTVGMAIDLRLVAANAVVVFGLAFGLILAKAALLAGLATAFRLERPLVVRLGVTLSQAGEFAFVVFTLAAGRNLLPDGVAPVLLAAVAISIALTPLLAALGRRAGDWLTPTPAPDMTGMAEGADELSDHVVVAGYGRIGQIVGGLLDRHDVSWLAVDADLALVAEHRRRGAPVYFGDAGRPEVLRAAGAGEAKAAVITLTDSEAAERVVAALRREHPDLVIVARSRDPAHARRLEQAGADSVILEALEPGLQMGAAALSAEGVPAAVVDKALDALRREASDEMASPGRPGAGRPGPVG